jgi:hypothetical protein
MSDNDNPYGLTDKEITICDNLVNNGFEKITKADEKIIAKSEAREYLDWKRDGLEKGHKLTYRYKLDKLTKIIDACIPDNIAYILENSDDINKNAAILKIGLAALHESNIMQGHHAAEKYITASVSFDASELKKTLEDFKSRYK